MRNTKKNTLSKSRSLLDFLGPHDLTTRTTLERIARQRCKVEPLEAKEIVNRLIAAGYIVETNRTGLLGETPVYQKAWKPGPLKNTKPT